MASLQLLIVLISIFLEGTRKGEAISIQNSIRTSEFTKLSMVITIDLIRPTLIIVNFTRTRIWIFG